MNSFILLWYKKCEKLENEVILVQRSASTINLWRKNEENQPILSDNDKKKSDCVFKCNRHLSFDIAPVQIIEWQWYHQVISFEHYTF